MANVRCPMCSKMNPPDAEVCSYCGARLKPVRPPSTPPASTPKQSEPDWLRGLAGISSQPEEGASGKASEAGSGNVAGQTAGKAPEPDSVKPAESSAVEPAAGSSDSGSLDWLSQIRDRSQADSGTLQEPGQGASSDTPDWLKGIDKESESSSFDDSFGLGSDWMNRLQNPLETTSPPAAPSQPQNASPFGDFDLAGSTGQPDWMHNLSDETPSGESGMDWAMEGDVSPFAGASTGEGDQEDWMKNLSGWTSEPPAGEGQSTEWKADQPASQEQSPSEPERGTGLDDLSWLNNLKPDSETPPPVEAGESKKDQGQVSSGTGLTGFLASLNEAESQQGFGTDFQGWEPSASEKAPSEPFPGWETEKPAAPLQAEPPASAESDISSWLRSFESEEPTAPTEQPESAAPEQPEEASSGIPSWLSGAPAEPEEPQASMPGEETGGLPSWLSGGFGSAEPLSEEAPSGPESEAGLPGWLSGTGEMPSAGQPETPAAPGAEAGGLPSWLSGGDTGLEQAAAEVPAPETPSYEGLPGWLSETEAPAASGQFAAEQPSAEEDQWSAGFPAFTDQPQAAEELPAEGQPADWLAGFEQAGTIEAAGAEAADAEAAGVEPVVSAAQPFTSDIGETPDWLREFNVQPSASASVPPLDGEQQGAVTPPAEETPSPFAVDLPDWLGEEAAAEPAEAAEHPGEPVNENLAQAELPDWVMKMRPLESVIPGEAVPGEADQRVEKAGPLAGMRGVLPAEEMVTRYRKPPIYSAKLRVTEKQRSQSTLLDSLLAQETQPLLVPPERSQAPRIILQIVLAVVLVVGVLFPLLTNFALLPSEPAMAPLELQNMFNQLNQSLQPNQPVLLAVDYEPGYSGEMRLAASAVVDQLMSKNARIVIVSTVPTGPALADALLSEAAKNHSSYQSGGENQVINLGYLPGGTISLIEFASYPRLAAPVTPFADQSPWNGALKNINTIADFSQVIVLADTAETGRAWVEQVGPSLKKVPLYMVASAQAAPMLLPYWESKQIQGMVTGLMGGSIYSSRLGHEQANQGQANNPAVGYYSAYQIGVFLGMALIIVGAVSSAGMALINRRSKDEA